MKINTLPDGYSIITARSFKEIEKIRPAWEYLQTKSEHIEFNVDIDHFITIATNLEETIRPHIILLKYKDEPTSLIVGRIDSLPLTSTIGYKVIYRPIVRSLSIILGGVLICNQEIICSILVNELLNSLKNRDVDIISFHLLPIQSEMIKFIKKSNLPFILRQYSKPNTHWQMNIPKTMEEFYASKSKNHRKSFRYYSNKIKKDFSDQINIKYYKNENEIDILLNDIEEVEKKTYQRGLQLDSKQYKANLTKMRIKLAARKNWLRSYIMYINNIPCAFQLGYNYYGYFFLSSTGYDPKFKKYSLGIFLFLEIIKEFCEDENINTWDFGRGDADYKRSFGTTSWQEVDVRLFPFTFKCVKIFLITNLISSLSRIIEKILTKMGFLNKIKRIWRDWFIKKVTK